ncbi:hypothetical protein BLNAU_22160 [Blattamonas nauphoetae]|uniref:Uncharacterized protein n=1 Tax=Blattamonas nauphoetae TaxID=2049346 RepID=A0ABQ9WTX5_9EUKA|nr:hypothetical protein BLNAU_22160 [Blattamonas nauphoetae]
MLGRRWPLVVHNTFFARADDVKSERGFASMMDKTVSDLPFPCSLGRRKYLQTDYQVVLTLCICLSEEEQIGSRVCACKSVRFDVFLDAMFFLGQYFVFCSFLSSPLFLSLDLVAPEQDRLFSLLVEYPTQSSLFVLIGVQKVD